MNETHPAQHRKPLIEDRLGLRARVQEHERALLVSLQTREQRLIDEKETLLELHTLCRTAGIEVVRAVIQRRNHPSASTLVYKGKVQEIKAMVEASGVDVVIFNDELTPMQGRNLEEQLHVKIVDRAQLIMDIFAQRAMTNDAKLQVELAQLKYLLPRLRGWGEALSRLGGGIGTRGPGETKLTLERRQLRTRIHRIEKALQSAKVKRSVNRQQRLKQGIPQVVLLGYTNMGKSTLLNQLTDADVLAEDKLFATLNPVARRLSLPDQSDVVLADTVGFIRKLPKQLVPAFQSTLESVCDADLLLHVLDASDPQLLSKWRSVQEILRDVLDDEAGWPPVLHVLNKIDAVATPEIEETLAYTKTQLPHTVEISALQGQGFETLFEKMIELLNTSKVLVELNVPYTKGQWLDRLHRQGEVQEQRYEAHHVAIEVLLPRVELEKIAAQAEGEGLSWEILKQHEIPDQTTL